MPKAKHKLKVPAEQGSDFLRNAPEVSVFMNCCVLVNEMRGLERAFESGEIIESALIQKSKDILAALTTAVRATERFNIVIPVTSFGEFSPFFWRWFDWWEDYFKGLTLRQIAEIETLARARSPDVDGYKPSGHWVSYRHDPGFALRIG
jgi:hypothetical protein